jgi:DNA-binding transcriptional ArsR family regulator
LGRLPEEQVDLAVELFRMLADATRFQVLWALVDREMAVNDLVEHVGKPGPAVSQHLARLRLARVVQTRREGNQVFYRLENDHVRRLMTDAVFNAEHAGPGVPTHHLDDAALTALTALTAPQRHEGASGPPRTGQGHGPAGAARPSGTAGGQR